MPHPKLRCIVLPLQEGIFRLDHIFSVKWLSRFVRGSNSPISRSNSAGASLLCHTCTFCHKKAINTVWVLFCTVKSSPLGQLTLHKIAHSDDLAMQLEQCRRYTDAVDTLEQASKMLVRSKSHNLFDAVSTDDWVSSFAVWKSLETQKSYQGTIGIVSLSITISDVKDWFLYVSTAPESMTRQWKALHIWWAILRHFTNFVSLKRMR